MIKPKMLAGITENLGSVLKDIHVLLDEQADIQDKILDELKLIRAKLCDSSKKSNKKE